MNLPEIRDRIARDGFCIIPDAISGEQLGHVRTALESTLDAMRQRGASTHLAFLDPNASSVRVDNLPERDPAFLELLRHPLVLEIARDMLGPDMFVSSFSGSIAMPGARSMRVHSDQALVFPAPWTRPVVFNAIWCLDDMHAANGATLYLPGSHLYRTPEEMPADPRPLMRPFEAKAGSVIIMEGRTWHTSGDNVTADERRALLFAFYSCGFVRGQINWAAQLSPETKAGLDAELRALLDVEPLSNIGLGTSLISLTEESWNETVTA